MLRLRGIKARPHDLRTMAAHQPSLVELHCSAEDLEVQVLSTDVKAALAVHVPEFSAGALLDPASPKEAMRSHAEAVYVKAVRAARRWATQFEGRPKVVFHPGGHTVETEAVQAKPFLDALERTVDAMMMAAADEVDVLIENLPGSCWFYGGSWRSQIMTAGTELAAFCLRNGIGCTLDLCHLHLAASERNLDAMHEIHACLPHVRHVHYSDAQYLDDDGVVVNREGVQVGEGNMPLRKYFEALGALRPDLEVHAVPEVWFGHEDGGRGFVQAWSRLDATLARQEARL